MAESRQPPAHSDALPLRPSCPCSSTSAGALHSTVGPGSRRQRSATPLSEVAQSDRRCAPITPCYVRQRSRENVCIGPMLGYLLFMEQPPFSASVVNCFPWRFSRTRGEETGVNILVYIVSWRPVAPGSAVVEIALQPIVPRHISKVDQRRVSAHPGGKEDEQPPAWPPRH